MADNSGISAKLAGLAGRFGKCVVALIDPQLNYRCCYINNNEQNFVDKAKKLDDAITELKEKVAQAKNKAQMIPGDVTGWLEDAAKFQMEELDRGIPNVRRSCLPIKSQFLLSKKDKKLVEAQEKLLKRYRSNLKSLFIPPTSKVPEQVFECPSRMQFEENVMKALKEKHAGVIGISGMGGIGKTTMVEKLAQRVMLEKLFDVVLTVDVGPDLDKLKIQQQIAEGLGLSLEGETCQDRAYTLRDMLTGSRKIFIVMDDLWDPLKVEDLGIPCETDITRCTILLTSRNTELLKKMNARVFSMQILDEAEAWSLFRAKVGTLVDDDQKLHSIATQLVRKCEGLPRALGILGGLLKDARSIKIWVDALHSLKSSKPGIPCFLEEVYRSLRLSYEHLIDSDAKSVFLLCSVFPEDSDINLNDLTMYCMSIRLFNGISTLEQTRNRVFTVVEMLKSCFLLLDDKSIRFVKMHGMVRDVALCIAREQGLVDANVKSPLNESKKIIVSPRTRSEFDDYLARIGYPRINLLGVHCSTRPLICNDLPCLRGMEELKSLSLSNLSFKLLPRRIKLMQHLRMLYLVDCMTLESISMVGELLQLEILICQRCYKIKELPVEMGLLKGLKVLEFGNCSNLERIAPGVITKLVELEELKMVHSFKGWEQTKVKEEELRNASLKELESLTKLTLLWIEIADVGLVEEEINLSSSIVNYRVMIGNMSPWIHNEFEKVVSFAGLPQDIHCGNWIQQIVRSTDVMHLEGDGSMNFDMSQLHSSINFLRLGKCKRVEELVDTTTMSTDDWRTSSGAFPKLESLMLENLPDLKRILAGPVAEESISFRKLFYLYLVELPWLKSLWKIPNQNASLCNLREINIWKCDKLQNIFFLESGKDVLFELRLLQIHECDMMEEVFYSEGDENINDGTNSTITSFPKLKRLALDSLPSLRTIGKRVGYIEFPLLTDLQILYCPMLTGFISNGSEQISLGDNEKIGFGSTLKRLSVSEHELCNLLISRGLFRGLEELVVQGWQSIESLLSSPIAENLVKIKRLTIEQCYMKEVIKNEENMEKTTEIKVCEVSFKIFPVLESLQLRNLPRLKVICDSSAYAGFNCFEYLRELHLAELPALKHLGISSNQGGSFISNLSRVTIFKCDELRDLFSWTMSKDQFMQLECLIIESCDLMKHVFSSNEENGKSSCITFSKLNELVLRDLTSLETFCIGVESIGFPVLEEMTICNCPYLRSIVSSTGCNGDDSSHVMASDHGDDSSHVFCCPQPTFGRLKKLWIMEYHFVNIWCHQHRPYFMRGLKELFIQDCGEIEILFSSSIVEILVNLECLVIESCNKMESVIGDEGSARDTYILFPRLTQLTLCDLPLVGNFCEWSCSLELPWLDCISIDNCPEMKCFTLGSSRTPKLKQITLDGQSFSADELDEMGGLNGIIRQRMPTIMKSTSFKIEEEEEEESHRSDPTSMLNSPCNFGQKSTSYDIELEEDKRDEKKIMSHSSTSADDISGIPPSSYVLPTNKESGSAEGVPVKEDIGTMAEQIDGVKLNEVNPEEPLHTAVQKEGYMRECFLYCSLFPVDYEFSRDTLIWSWIAAGLLNSEQSGETEAVAVRFFDRLIRLNYILPSGYDTMGDQMKYKVENDKFLFFSEQASKNRYRKMPASNSNMAEVEHLSFISEQINQIQLESIRECTHLKTLLLHKSWGSEFQKSLHDLFLDLKFLTKLDLSSTNIEELPSSVENLKALRYLDMSKTPIRRLPESIDSLGCLETLVLVRCLSLYSLPKCMYKLVKLQHLLVDFAQLLQSMPIHIGKLTNLQTLGVFVIGTKDGCGIGELRNMNKLKGSLCLMKLENILNVDEAREACLADKGYLSKLEFIWGDLEDAKVTMEEKILECLRPHFGLQELKIVSYSGGVLPSWISNPSFAQIASITLHGCRYCEKLPSLGELPSLKSLKIVGMDELVSIDELFCQKQANQDRQPFPKLERLLLEGMSNLKTWTGVEDGHFPYLRELLIKCCQKLTALPNLSYLISLQHLEICYCPMLSHLPEGGLPTSLQYLMLNDCPILTERCSNERGEDSAKVAGVPALYIDHQKIGTIDHQKI